MFLFWYKRLILKNYRFVLKIFYDFCNLALLIIVITANTLIFNLNNFIMHEAEFLVAILIPLGAFAMIFGIVYIKSRENMALIDKGINPKEPIAQPSPFRYFKWAMLLVGAGLGLLLANLMHTYVLPTDVSDDNPAVYFSLIAIGGGLGLFSAYKIEKKEFYDKKKDQD